MTKIRKVGSVSKLNIEDNTTYTIEHLLYINSQHETIERLYKFLRTYYEWSKNNETIMSFTELRKKHRADVHLLPIMKKYGYSDNSSTWVFEFYPSKADAVFIQLKLREYYRAVKNKATS